MYVISATRKEGKTTKTEWSQSKGIDADRKERRKSVLREGIEVESMNNVMKAERMKYGNKDAWLGGGGGGWSRTFNSPLTCWKLYV